MTHEERAELRRNLSLKLSWTSVIALKELVAKLLDALDAAEARAALAERQVRVLAEELASRDPQCVSTQECPPHESCGSCPHTFNDADAWIAWSSAQAAQGGGGGE